jgi:hypothetical protein
MIASKMCAYYPVELANHHPTPTGSASSHFGNGNNHTEKELVDAHPPLLPKIARDHRPPNLPPLSLSCLDHSSSTQEIYPTHVAYNIFCAMH